MCGYKGAASDEHFNATILGHAYYLFVMAVGSDKAGAVLQLVPGTLPPTPTFESVRAAFVLREVEGLSTAETAECLEISEEAAKVRLHRAKKLLRADLERRLGAAVEGVYDFHLSRCDRVVARVFERIESKKSTR